MNENQWISFHITDNWYIITNIYNTDAMWLVPWIEKEIPIETNTAKAKFSRIQKQFNYIDDGIPKSIQNKFMIYCRSYE